MIKEIQNPPHFQLIDNDKDLLTVCRQAEQKSAVALDTEFIRIRTYYPKLGLIQLYDGDDVNLIMPENIQDFSPFIALLANKQVTKILHSCSEDLEVFHHYFKQLPQPMVDTQIVANFLGFGNSTGFAALVNHYFQLELDKGASRTDWLARPLSEKQLNYAAADVWYLLPLYHKMQADLAQTPWQSAVENDCELLLEKTLEVKNPDEAYFNISNAWKLQGVELARLHLLAKWRQKEAIKRDLAVNFVVKAESLWLAAKHNPKNSSDLLALDIHPNEVRHHGKKILAVLNKANKLDVQDYLPTIVRISDHPKYKSTLKALQQKLREITPQGLKSEVVASNRSLERLIKWVWIYHQDPAHLPDLLKGWRREIGVQLQILIAA
ncbi:ribonuclease D [Cricetibacter osteomyelitidis]|uniref:Ribonuclease D n=1 Tax=Cricetibacter osteomyelitidis TaxID=1521931 RepID=A0A4R2SSZ5_9PAST|nr:ribonuclease D [Cricetibacter osteomyelitidis]TCP93459.1 ribonuclease D [Cricetibacter osteomyelitidis]